MLLLVVFGPSSTVSNGPRRPGLLCLINLSHDVSCGSSTSVLHLGEQDGVNSPQQMQGRKGPCTFLPFRAGRQVGPGPGGAGVAAE